MGLEHSIDFNFNLVIRAMAFCKQFMDALNLINFIGDSGEQVRNTLIIHTYNELSKELMQVRALLDVPMQKSSNKGGVNEQLQEMLNRLSIQCSNLEKQAAEKNINLTVPPVTDASFVKDFAVNFGTIRHLSYALTDAPQAIKNLQVNLCIELLLNLKPNEQESQLADCSLFDIQGILQHLALLVEQSPQALLDERYQGLAHKGIYELVRRTCELVNYSETVSSSHQYLSLLSSLTTKLSELGLLTNNLSVYRGECTKTLLTLLVEAEQRLRINLTQDWMEKEVKEVLIQRKQFLEQFNVGPRSYQNNVWTIEDNLAYDLFWARGINEVELLTKEKERVADHAFLQLIERRYLSQFVAAEGRDESIRKRLIGALSAIKTARKVEGKEVFPIGDNKNPIVGEDRYNALIIIRDCLEEEFSKPIIHQNADGQFLIGFFSFVDSSEITAEKLLDYIANTKLGGFGRDPVSVIRPYVDEPGLVALLDSVKYQLLTGFSLTDIKAKVVAETFSEQEQHDFNRVLDELKKRSVAAEVAEKRAVYINELKLSSHDELLLRKLLELRYSQFYLAKTLQFSTRLQQAFFHLDAGDYTNALAVEGVDADVLLVYTQLASLPNIFSVEQLGTQGLNDPQRSGDELAQFPVNALATAELAQKQQLLQTIINQCRNKNICSLAAFMRDNDGLELLKLLSTVPMAENHQAQVIDILNQLNSDEIETLFLGNAVSRPSLFHKCIVVGQEVILVHLLQRMRGPAFLERIAKEGLLHYAAEHKMAGVFKELINTLRRSGVAQEDIFSLMMRVYEAPGEHQTPIRWASNCFHSAIRNNDKEQLHAVLQCLPPGNNYALILYDALYFCSALGNEQLFNQILTKYNQLNPQAALETETLLKKLFPVEYSSSYHWFRRDKHRKNGMAWQTLEANLELANLVLQGDISPLLMMVLELDPHSFDESLEQQIARLQADVKELLGVYGEELDALRKELNTANATLKSTQSHLASTQKMLNAISGELKNEKNGQAKLQTEIAQIREEKELEIQKVEFLQTERLTMQALMHELQEKDTNIQEMQKELDSKNEKIVSLCSQLDEWQGPMEQQSLVEIVLLQAKTNTYFAHLNAQKSKTTLLNDKKIAVSQLKKILEQIDELPSKRLHHFQETLRQNETKLKEHRDPCWQRFFRDCFRILGLLISGVAFARMATGGTPQFFHPSEGENYVEQANAVIKPSI